MPQPTPYNRVFDFQEFSATYPLNQQPGVYVDAELDAVKATLDDVLRNIALIQRDDGSVANKTIGLDQVSDTLLAAIGVGGFRVRGLWTQGTAYYVGDLITSAGAPYLVVVSHTSAVALSVDINAGRVFGPILGGADSTTLRSQLASTAGATYVNTSTGATVEDRLGTLDASTSGFSVSLSAQGLVNASLDSRITATQASLTTEQTTRATAVSALASSITSLTATVTTNSSGITALGARMSTAEANITSESSTRASADSAISSNVTSLTSRVTTSEGNITSLAGRTTAAEGNISSILTRVTTAEANITSEASTRATADTAMASNITSVTSSVTTLSGQMGTANYNISVNAAAITSEASTRAYYDGALSSNISSVSTTVAGHTADISSLYSSVNGVAALYSMTTDVDGFVSGLYQYSTSTYSSVKIRASEFQIDNPAGGGATFTPFTVDTVNNLVKMTNVYVDSLVAGSVTSPSLALNATTQFATSTGASVGGTGAGSWHLLTVAYITMPLAGWVTADAVIVGGFSAPLSYFYGVDLQIDNISSATGGFTGSSAAAHPSFAVKNAQYVAAGVHTLALYWYGSTNMSAIGGIIAQGFPQTS